MKGKKYIPLLLIMITFLVIVGLWYTIINKDFLVEPNETKIIKDCMWDSDCEWKITNCCSESAGGYWECINKKSKIVCENLVLCPQVLSPKPSSSCVCENRGCTVK